MKFIIQITTKNGKPISIDTSRVGMEMVKKVRDIHGNVPIELFPNSVDYFRKVNVPIEINEELAKKTGQFNERQLVTVIVADMALNQFCEKTFKTIHGETGNMEEVEFLYRIQKEEIITRWIQDGSPLEWGISAKTRI